MKWYRVKRESCVVVAATSVEEAKKEARKINPECWRNAGEHWADGKDDDPEYFDVIIVEDFEDPDEPCEDCGATNASIDCFCDADPMDFSNLVGR